jgi:RHS repeat-associated protein
MLEGTIDDVRFEQVRYLYDGIEVLHEHSSRQDHQTIAFYRAGGRLVAQFRYSTSYNFSDGQTPRMYLDYYSHDGLGSVATLTHYEDDENHQPIRYRYSAFGAIVQGDFTNNPYGYTSRRFDHENGFYHYHFRKYDPVTGNWLTSDPIGIAGGINLYRFVGNNPVNYRDWLGLYGTDADEDANSVGVGTGLENEYDQDDDGLDDLYGDPDSGWGSEDNFSRQGWPCHDYGKNPFKTIWFGIKATLYTIFRVKGEKALGMTKDKMLDEAGMSLPTVIDAGKTLYDATKLVEEAESIGKSYGDAVIGIRGDTFGEQPDSCQPKGY